MTKKINEVFLTDEYSQFKTIKGNRDTKQSRVNKILASFNNVGVIPAPIVCNEKMEVIDGQGRLEALKQIGGKVPYIVIKGLGIKECIEMNIHQTKWSVQQYIDSYAEQGNINYIRLRDFINFSPFSFVETLWAVTGSATRGKGQLQSGAFVITEKMISDGIEILDYWKSLDFTTNSKSNFYVAVGYCLKMDCINKVKLREKINSAGSRDFIGISSVETAIHAIDDVYNFRAKNMAPIFIEYKKLLSSKKNSNSPIWKK